MTNKNVRNKHGGLGKAFFSKDTQEINYEKCSAVLGPCTGHFQELAEHFLKEIQDFCEVFIVVLQKKRDEYLVVYVIDCNFAEKSE